MKWMLTLVLLTGAIVGYEGGELLAGRADVIDWIALGMAGTFVALMYFALFTNAGEKESVEPTTPAGK